MNAFLRLAFAGCGVIVYGQSYSLTTVAGSARPVAGSALETPFRAPSGIAQAADGTLYVSDAADHVIRKVPLAGPVTTLAGTGEAGFSGDGGPAQQARLNTPAKVRLDGRGNLYFVDQANFRIRKIVLATGVITTVAGNGSIDFNGDGRPGPETAMRPVDIAVDGTGDIYLADWYQGNPTVGRIRKVSVGTGAVSHVVNVASQRVMSLVIDSKGVLYYSDSSGYVWRRTAEKVDQIYRFYVVISPAPPPDLSTYIGAVTALALDANGDLLVARPNAVVKLASSDFHLEAIAGVEFQSGLQPVGDSPDGTAAPSTLLDSPSDVTVGNNFDILVADRGNGKIRRIGKGILSTVAGVGVQTGVAATSAFLFSPSAVVAGSAGFWIADLGHGRLRQVSASGRITNGAHSFTFVSSTGQTNPEALARDGSTLYASDANRPVVFTTEEGKEFTVFAGQPEYFPGSGGDGGSAAGTTGRLYQPKGIAVDAQHNVYIADLGNCRIRIVNPQGLINTFAGNGTCTASGDGSFVNRATLTPYGLTIAGGSLYVAERDNHRVRKIDLTTNIISTVVGTGTAGYAGDGGPAGVAQLNGPTGVAVDAAGNLWIADSGNHVVRVVKGFTISTAAGIPGSSRSNAESGPARSISFDPVGLSALADGSILVADKANDRVRLLTEAKAATFSIVAGNNASAAPGEVVRLVVKVEDAVGAPFTGHPVTFAVTRGAATILSPNSVTDSSGLASVNVTLGSTPVSVQVIATAAGLPALAFEITIRMPSSPGPVIRAGGIASAGLSAPPVQVLAPVAIASIFGERFGAGESFSKVGAADLLGNKVPTVFRGVCVEVGGIRAPVFGASDSQINFQVPAVGTSGSVNVRVLTNCGTATERASDPLTVSTQDSAPEFFYLSHTSDGKNAVAATDALAGAVIAPDTLFPGSGFAPARIGQIVTVFGTGFGATNPGVEPGAFPAGIATVTAPVRVFLGGVELNPSDILYVGATPNSPGLYQLNIRIPVDTRPGNQPLALQLGTARSPEGPYLAIQ